MDVCNQLPLKTNGNTGIVPPGSVSAAGSGTTGDNSSQSTVTPATKEAGMPWWMVLLLVGAGVSVLINANSSNPGKK